MRQENPKFLSGNGNGGGSGEGSPAAGQSLATDNVTLTRNNSGRVKFDDRGNAVWEWAQATGAFGLEPSTVRLKKLEVPGLSLVDDAPPGRGAQNPRGTLNGYSPYDSGVLVKKQAQGKKTDLRRLGEFMKLRRQAESNKRGSE